MKTCRYCKHCKNDTKMNTTNMAIGVAVFGFPMITYDNIQKCDNYKSTYYGMEVNDYDKCSKFNEK